MTVKEPGWILDTSGKGKMKKKIKTVMSTANA